MPSLPLKQAYGPTLPQLTALRWRSWGWATRSLALAAVAGLIALLAGFVLHFMPPVYSGSAPVPFSFSYTGLYRVPAQPGWLVSVQRPQTGRFQDSFAVRPLRLPAYSGSLTAELALYAGSWERSLARRFGASFRPDGAGVPEVKNVDIFSGYQLFYSAKVEGQLLYGRDVMLLPEGPHPRDGVVIRMLSAAGSATWLTSPLLVGSEGILASVMESFALR